MKARSLAGLLLLTIPVGVAGVPSPAHGQTSSKADSTARTSPASRRYALVRSADLKYLLGATALIGAAYAGDRSVERRFSQRNLQDNHGLRETLNAAGALGDPGTIVFSAVVYFSGIATHSRSVAALGMYTGEAVVLGGVVSETLKGLAGRARPKIDTTRVRDFQFGRGFSNDDYGSFPSAETTIAFAAATASSLYVRREWPSAAHIVTPVAYTAATLVGVSRIYKNEHWASDVVTGAVIGSLAGVGFDRWNRAHPNNVFERVFLPRSFSSTRGRATVVWYFEVQ